MALKNLLDLQKVLGNRYDSLNLPPDVELPMRFRDVVNFGTEHTITYNRYSFVAENSNNQRLYLPNQLIYIAAFFAEYYIALQDYFLVLKDVLTEEEEKKCIGNRVECERFVDKLNVEYEDKEYLVEFLFDRKWWAGGKSITRTNDYFYSPILSQAKLINASQSFVAEICRYLAGNPHELNILTEEIKKYIPQKSKKLVYQNKTVVNFMAECMRQFLAYDTNLSQANNYIKENTSTIGFTKCPIGELAQKANEVTDERRKDDCDNTISWFHNQKEYYFWKEQSHDSFMVFQIQFNRIYKEKFHIEEIGNEYFLYEINGDDFSVSAERSAQPRQAYTIPNDYTQYVSAIKTKPFVLLAGISGTGKSRIVRQLARACDTLDSNPWAVQTPQNFEMVQVRPDWHDSSELLGYESRISGKPEYVVKNFIKFIVRAWLHEDVPFFLCLDEMNLAPVEQYFAEYLSVVESRRMDDQGNIVCDPLIKLNRQHCQSIVNEILQPSESDENDADQLNQAEEMMILLEGMDYTLPLPKNLIVMGTVNMDETTFSFSRKVLDRAMTIEMNEVDLKGGLTDTENERFHINANDILPNAVEGKDVYAANQLLCDRVIKYLEQVNEVLEGTPFKIAYRTRNEFLIYAVNRGEEHFVEAMDEMTSMKILSRIEGDQDKVGDVLNQLKSVLTNNSIPDDGKSLPKIEEMNTKLDKGYTSYWS